MPEPRIVDRGTGVPFVLVPGIQGRWEWIAPTVDVLAARERVITYSFCDEPTSGFACDERRGFASYIDQLETVLDRSGLDRAVIVGVSYGGLVAGELAARRPERVAGLVLASALPLDWIPDRRVRFYLRAPRALCPLFCAGAPLRLYPEIVAAYPGLGARARFVASQGAAVLRAFLSPTRMARRVRWAEAHAFADPSRIVAPTLVVTGERQLDRVVPTIVTERCTRGLRRVRTAVLARTGHLGIMTRPEAFTDLLAGFVAAECGPIGIHEPVASRR